VASLIDRAIAAEPSDPALMARPLRVHTRDGTITNHDTDEGRARLGGHVSRARHRREGAPRPDDPRDRLGCRDRDRLVAWVARTPPVGTTIRFTLVSRAFGPRSEAGLGLSVEAAGFPDRYHKEARPFEVERKALRIGPESSVGAGRVGPLVTPAGGLPAPKELAAGHERDQVSGWISISAPFSSPSGSSSASPSCGRPATRRSRAADPSDARTRQRRHRRLVRAGARELADPVTIQPDPDR
jgi:hypothetical protein